MYAGRPIIGIAGGIGAGKSRVARMFESAGCCRVASDEMVAAAYTHPEVKRAIVERFGPEVIDPSGQIDRRRIADIVFTNVAQRQWLEGVLHPVANAARVEVMDQASRDPRVLAYVWDSPLLFEAKLNELCDVVVLVDAPRSDRLRRLAERGWDAQELDRREKVQMPLDKKRSLADYHLHNPDNQPVTPDQVEGLLQEILARCSAGSACACAATGGCGHRSAGSATEACCRGEAACDAAARSAGKSDEISRRQEPPADISC